MYLDVSHHEFMTESCSTSMKCAPPLGPFRALAYLIETQRDWDALIALATGQAGFEPVVQLLNEVHAREHIHEKFWRYVKLALAYGPVCFPHSGVSDTSASVRLTIMSHSARRASSKVRQCH